MKKFLFFCLASAPLLASCGPTDQQIGQTILYMAPAGFLSALALQYLLFRLWKRKQPALTVSWRPSLIFLGALIVGAAVVTIENPIVFFATPDASVLYALLAFVPSCLTVILIATRIWLASNPSSAFTWAPIVAMALYILPAFPLLANAHEGFGQIFAYYWWIPPGGWFPYFFAGGGSPGFPGWLTLLVFTILLIEAALDRRRVARLLRFREPPPTKQ